MATTFSSCRRHVLLLLQLLVVGASVGLSESALNKTTITSKELQMIHARLRSLNKPPLKSIQSPDGDIIDCVPFHLQPAFDDPMLKRLIKPLDPPKMVKNHEYANDTVADDLFQLWRSSGETCPEGTVAIRRTKEEDIIRAGSVEMFGKKPVEYAEITNIKGSSHEHSVGIVRGDEIYGARATLNVWNPQLRVSYEFSLAQLWLTAGSYSNTIEVGWMVYPKLFGDRLTRIFIFWTSDRYKNGCYNLLCSGFVQTSRKIAVGAAISPVSTYNGRQNTILLTVLKRDDGNW
ncbi:hypothetical protein Cni_G16862 [Canna indica]|uniref:Neprosin PEP catalytic domain-containing protein n=1 Tax=Canna indica TaxID=4628 RepID=A0AAQ3KG00_9LILI|nr:hypothetical protein Cni_G16862 [Canna indica]